MEKLKKYTKICTKMEKKPTKRYLRVIIVLCNQQYIEYRTMITTNYIQNI